MSNPKISLTQKYRIGKKSTNTNTIEKIFETRLKVDKTRQFTFQKNKRNLQLLILSSTNLIKIKS